MFYQCLNLFSGLSYKGRVITLGQCSKSLKMSQDGDSQHYHYCPLSFLGCLEGGEIRAKCPAFLFCSPYQFKEWLIR